MNGRRLAAVLAVGAAVCGCVSLAAPREGAIGGAAGLLVPAPGSPVAIDVRAMAAGDVNGDRRADLVLLAGTTLKVLFGRASGAWRAEADVAAELPAKGSELALADLDRDGRLDLVLADHDRYDVGVLLGAGDGRFRAAPGSPFTTREGTKPHTHGLAVADFNGDGQPDIVTANNSDGDLSLLLGDGRGGFRRAARSPFPCGTSPYPIAAADLNGDGAADVLVPNSNPGQARTLHVLLGSAAGELLPGPGSPLACRGSVWWTASGDLNGDGQPDAVATHNSEDPAGGTLAVFLNQGGGKLAPAPGDPLSIGHPAWGVRVADMDRDGRADLVLGADEGIRVFTGDGRGGFQPAAGSPYPTGKGAWTVVAADLNGDGKLDAATRCVEARRLEVFYGR